MAFVAALTSPSFLALSTCLLTFARAPEVQNHLSVEPGQPAALTCRTSSNITVKVVEWIRPGLDPKYVFLYRNRQVDRLNQHPSFRNRVELKDQQMKDGDVSVTLTNVTVNDTDTSHLTSHSLLTGGGAGDISDGGDKAAGNKRGYVAPLISLLLLLLLFVSIIERERCWSHRSTW